MIEYTVASTDSDLEQILQLQIANRPENLTPEEMEREGFVSARHDMNLLRDMKGQHSHIVAKTIVVPAKNDQNDNGDDEEEEQQHSSSRTVIIGYTLCLLSDFDANRIAILDGFNKVLEATYYQGTSLKDLKYVITGQVCIAKEYRGKGIFAGLYNKMKEVLSPHFDCIVTSISSRNQRSLRAHMKIGFQKVHEYSSFGEDWNIILWDWKV